MPRRGRPAGAEIARRDPEVRFRRCLALAALAAVALPRRASAMHIADGVLPPAACLGWAVACIPFVAASLRAYRRRTAADPFAKALVATAAALVFVFSSVEIPLPLGTSAHACGVGLAAILLGPSLAVLAALVAVVLEAFLLGHGGVTALGADLASMGIAGAFAGWAVFRALRGAGAGVAPAAFAGALAANLATYGVASLQLASALAPPGAFARTLLGVAVGYAPAELPMIAIESVITSIAVAFLAQRRRDVLVRLGVVAAEPG
jgi:cobalt/nickel transport system permease protein